MSSEDKETTKGRESYWTAALSNKGSSVTMDKKISSEGTLSNQDSRGKAISAAVISDEPPVLSLLDAKDPR